MQTSTGRSKSMEKKMDTCHRWMEVVVVQLAYSRQQATQWVSKHRPPFTHLSLTRDGTETPAHICGSSNEVGGE